MLICKQYIFVETKKAETIEFFIRYILRVFVRGKILADSRNFS